MGDIISGIKNFFSKNPAIFLLFFVYFFFIPSLLSYDHAWIEPEEFSYKAVALINGPALQWSDVKAGMDWQGFEHAPRTTRPLSAYFEILDTKFRCWLWQFMVPHPSLSLTWIFSFIITPLLLFLLLGYWKVSVNTSMSIIAFYLMTPAVMSYAVMLFHPGKPMSNFSMVLCLYAASRLQKKFLDQKKKIPVGYYISFWVLSAFSFYWDEIMWVIVPAVWVLFPKVVMNRKTYLVLWLSLPFIAVLFYFKGIPFLMMSAGFAYPDILQYDKTLPVLTNPIAEYFQYLPGNTKNLILQTMGIMVPDIFQASLWIKLCSVASLASWGCLFFYLVKAKWRWDKLTFFLVGLILFFNFLMTININGIWGPYYYGTFWSIFFCIWLGAWLERSRIPGILLAGCFFFILLGMFYSFSSINTVYKEHQYYPYKPWDTSQFFDGEKSFFGQTPRFSGAELQKDAEAYWLASQEKSPSPMGPMPRELFWLTLELHPDLPHAEYVMRAPSAYFTELSLAQAYNDRGTSYDRQGKFSFAIADYTRAIQADPKCAQAYYNRANDYYYHLNNAPQALSDYSGAIESNPQDGQSYMIRAFIYSAQDKLPEALSDFNNAIRINPDSRPIPDYNRNTVLVTDSSQLYYDRGLIYARQGNISQALADYAQAIALKPNFALAYNNRAVCYYQLKEFDKALADVDNAQELGQAVNPGFINALKEAAGGGRIMPINYQ